MHLSWKVYKFSELAETNVQIIKRQGKCNSKHITVTIKTVLTALNNNI